MSQGVPAGVGESPLFDVIVIGGGIIGCGIARDAALRGLSVALIEKHDFGSGTTAGSTRLIHGGLRYLWPPATTAWCAWTCASARRCCASRRTW